MCYAGWMPAAMMYVYRKIVYSLLMFSSHAQSARNVNARGEGLEPRLEKSPLVCSAHQAPGTNKYSKLHHSSKPPQIYPGIIITIIIPE